MLRCDLDAFTYGVSAGALGLTRKGVISLIYIKSVSNISINGTVFFLEVVSHAKYLGVTLNEDLSWSPHISAIVAKAHQRLGFIRPNKPGSPFKSRETTYISLVWSHLDYCASM